MPGASRGRTDRASLVVEAETASVYRTFSDAGSFMAWLPPGDMTGRALEYDFREGGRYRIELTYVENAGSNSGKTTSSTDISTGRFVSLEPSKRIVQTVEFESNDASIAGEMVMTWSFEAVQSGTRVTVTAENVPPGVTQADHDEGLRSSLENLARYVAERSDRTGRRRACPSILPADHFPDPDRGKR
ncbi:MAG TPA: SRPBCC domain-containing protein [Actinomycetota bacterium]|nr:SRPBCC domain-containing protein [Actinomycetota bacterium]